MNIDLKQFISKLPSPAVIDAGDYFYFNEATEKIIGYTTLEIDNLDKWFELIFCEKAESIKKQYLKNKENNFPKTTILPVITKNNEKKFLEFSGFKFNDSAIWIINDATEEYLKKVAIEQSNKKYKFLLQNVPINIAVITGGVITFMNSVACKTLKGESPEDFIGRNAFDFVHPDYRTISVNRINKLKEPGDINEADELKYVCLDGSVIDVEVTSQLIIYEGKPSVQVTFKDVTNENKLKKELEFIHLIYRESIENANGVPYLYNYNTGKYDFIGKACKNLFGIESEEITPQDISRQILFYCLLEPSNKDLSEVRENFIKGEVSNFKAEFKIVSRENKIKWISDFAVPLKNSSGKVYASMGILQDITTYKLIEIELEKAKEQAELAERLKSEFLAQMSHELKNPIHSIINMTEILKDDLADKVDKEITDGFDLILEAGERISHAIDKILHASQVQSGSYEPSFEVVNLIEIIQSQIHEQEAHASKKNLFLELKSPEDVIKLKGDRFSLVQLFNNLISNAIKYTLEGKVIIEVIPKDGFAIVKVADTGIGMSKEFQNKIFNSKFLREDTKHKHRIKGTGLGLNLVKKYCEINSVEIKVESQQNIGTTFTLKFKTI